MAKKRGSTITIKVHRGTVKWWHSQNIFENWHCDEISELQARRLAIWILARLEQEGK